MSELAAVPTSPLVAIPSRVLPADRSPARVYLARLGPGSRRTMKRALDTIADHAVPGATADTLPWWELRYQHVAAIRAALAERMAPATVNKHLAALRGVLREAWRLGLMPAEDYQRAADVEGVRGSTLPAGRHVTAGELAALAAACRADPGPAGVRDAAMLAVAFTAGVRLAELVGLDLADVDQDEGALRVRQGKGRKERMTYIDNGGLAALLEWIDHRGPEPGPLFCPIDQRGQVSIRRLTGQAVYMRFRKRAAQAGLAARFSPHDGRRTWIGDLLDAGADIATVQQLAGHASVTTTARYDRRPEHAKRRAAGLLHFPWSA
jgi:integrase